MKEMKSYSAFTLIELMVSLVLTVLVLATFFRFFNHVTTAEANNSYKASLLTQGEASLETVANALSLVGLTNTNLEFIGATPRIIQETLGTTSGVDNPVVLTFTSPFGGPITKMMKVAGTAVTGTAPVCTFRVIASASTSGTRGKIRIIANDDIYYADLSYMNAGRAVTTAMTTSDGVSGVTGQCDAIFFAGNIITGPNYFYRLTWAPAAALKFERVVQPVPFVFNSGTSLAGPTHELIFSIPPEQARFVILEFLRLDPATQEELWENGRAYTVDDYRNIKAVRIAVVMLPKTAKKKGGTGAALTICPFKTNCITIDDISKPPMVFKKVIYLKNLDYLERGNRP